MCEGTFAGCSAVEKSVLRHVFSYRRLQKLVSSHVIRERNVSCRDILHTQEIVLAHLLSGLDVHCHCSSPIELQIWSLNAELPAQPAGSAIAILAATDSCNGCCCNSKTGLAVTYVVVLCESSWCAYLYSPLTVALPTHCYIGLCHLDKQY